MPEAGRKTITKQTPPKTCFCRLPPPSSRFCCSTHSSPPRVPLPKRVFSFCPPRVSRPRRKLQLPSSSARPGWARVCSLRLDCALRPHRQLCPCGIGPARTAAQTRASGMMGGPCGQQQPVGHIQQGLVGRPGAAHCVRLTRAAASMAAHRPDQAFCTPRPAATPGRRRRSRRVRGGGKGTRKNQEPSKRWFQFRQPLHVSVHQPLTGPIPNRQIARCCFKRGTPGKAGWHASSPLMREGSNLGCHRALESGLNAASPCLRGLLPCPRDWTGLGWAAASRTCIDGVPHARKWNSHPTKLEPAFWIPPYRRPRRRRCRDRALLSCSLSYGVGLRLSDHHPPFKFPQFLRRHPIVLFQTALQHHHLQRFS